VPSARITPQSTDGQDLNAYWDPKYANVLDTWGADTVWVEIPLLLWPFDGRVLDIACGTGKTIEILAPLSRLEIHGCDISNVLLQRAVERGIPSERLTQCDARDMPYEDQYFVASYSIGSLEHFPDETIVAFLRECRRVTRGPAFHQIPVSSGGRDHGWIHQGRQSYHNNSVGWWLERFRSVYPNAQALASTWRGGGSEGRWFICVP
jgi:ubiquinone/menaquinone biosynthesis C-methylase UbiE